MEIQFLILIQVNLAKKFKKMKFQGLTKSNYKSHNTNLNNLGLNKNKIIYKNKSNL